MDYATLSIAVDSSGVKDATASMQGLTVASKEVEAATTTLKTAQGQSTVTTRMSNEELQKLKDSYAALRVRQDAFLQSLDKQAATMGSGAAAMRAYKAEQLGLTNDKTFSNLNKQITDLENNGPSSIDKMATRIEGRIGTMVLRMGVHLVLVTAIIGAVTGIYHMLTDVASQAKESQRDLWLGLYDDIVKAEKKLNDYKSGLAGLSDAEQKGLNAMNWEKTKAQARLNDALVAQRNLPKTYTNAEGTFDVDQGGAAREARALVEKRRAELQEIEDNLAYVDSQRKQAQAINDTTQSLKDAAAAYLALKKSQSAFFEQQATLDNKATMDESQLLDAQMDRLKIMDSMTRAIMQQRLEARALNVELTTRDSKNYEIGAPKTTGIKQILDDIEKTQGLADPHRGEMKALDADKALFAANGGLLDPVAREKAYRNLEMRTLLLKAHLGDTWALIGQVVVDSSVHATDAMVTWMDNLDGVGRSWKSLGDTVRNVLRDMIIQMQKAIIQQQLMKPLMDGFGGWIGGLFGGSGTAGSSAASGVGSTGSGAGSFSSGLSSFAVGTDYVPYDMIAQIHQGEAIIPAAQNRGGGTTVINAPVTIHIESNGQISTEASTAAAVDLATRISRGEIHQWAMEQSRSNGLLARV